MKAIEQKEIPLDFCRFCLPAKRVSKHPFYISDPPAFGLHLCPHHLEEMLAQAKETRAKEREKLN